LKQGETLILLRGELDLKNRRKEKAQHKLERGLKIFLNLLYNEINRKVACGVGELRV
jgi:hypothetical protein